MQRNTTNLTAIKRKPRRRRNNPRLTSVGRYAEDAYSLGLRTFRGLNQLRKLINSEWHRFDTTAVAAAISQAGTVAALTNIAQGDDVNNRTGDSIKTQKISFMGHLRIGAAATQTAVRVIIVRDHENQGANPTGADVLQRAGNADVPTSLYTYVNSPHGQSESRFTIVMDEVATLCVTGEQNQYLSFESVLTQHVRYSGTAAGNTREGALFILFFTNEGTNTPTIDFNVGVWYTDN